MKHLFIFESVLQTLRCCHTAQEINEFHIEINLKFLFSMFTPLARLLGSRLCHVFSAPICDKLLVPYSTYRTPMHVYLYTPVPNMLPHNRDIAIPYDLLRMLNFIALWLA